MESNCSRTLTLFPWPLDAITTSVFTTLFNQTLTDNFKHNFVYPNAFSSFGCNCKQGAVQFVTSLCLLNFDDYANLSSNMTASLLTLSNDVCDASCFTSLPVLGLGKCDPSLDYIVIPYLKICDLFLLKKTLNMGVTKTCSYWDNKRNWGYTLDGTPPSISSYLCSCVHDRQHRSLDLHAKVTVPNS